MNQGWRNSVRNSAFVIAHLLLVVLAGVYLYECTAILRHAGLS